MGVALFLFLQSYEEFSSDWSDTISQFYGIFINYFHYLIFTV